MSVWQISVVAGLAITALGGFCLTSGLIVGILLELDFVGSRIGRFIDVSVAVVLFGALITGVSFLGHIIFA